jgi:two-component system, chemotaxis family, chemotaxis protein CheY
MRVLIVDDSKIARMQARKALPPACHGELVEVSDGRQALDACRAGSFDLMLLDLTMPEMNGYQVLEAIRDLPGRPPVVVMSADIQPKAKERVLSLGAIGLVPKPATAGAILELLEQAGVLK